MVSCSQISLTFVWMLSIFLVLPFNNNVVSLTEVERISCTGQNAKEVRLPLGWPAVVSCSEHEDVYADYVYFEELTNQSLIHCEITSLDTSEVVFNQTFELNDIGKRGYDLGELHSSSPTRFHISTSATDSDEFVACHNNNLTVIPFAVETESCEEVISTDVSSFVPTRSFPIRELSPADIHSNSDYERSRIYHNLNVTWKFNCSAIHEDLIDYGIVTLLSVDFPNAGFYTLSTTYKSMTLYLYKVRLCVKNRIIPATPNIVCQNERFLVERNSTIVIPCRANLGYDLPNSAVVSSITFKENISNPVCRNAFEGTKNAEGAFQGNCTSRLDVGDDPCYISVPTPGELAAREESFYFTYLTLRVEDDDDFGNYIYVFFYYHYKYNVTFTITDKIIHNNRFDNSGVIIGVIIGTVAFLLIVLTILWYFLSLYIQVFFKRKFGPFKSDEGYDYDAFISYNISLETSEEEKRALFEMVSKTTKHLNDLGYQRIYNPDESDFGQYRETLVYDKITKSHRVFVFIASQNNFADDSYRQILQLSLNNTVDHRTKVITVIDKRMVEVARKSNDEHMIPLKECMKEGYVVHWPSSSPTCFRYSLEKAMPVFKKPSKESGDAPHTNLTVL